MVPGFIINANCGQTRQVTLCVLTALLPDNFNLALAIASFSSLMLASAETLIRLLAQNKSELWRAFYIAIGICVEFNSMKLNYQPSSPPGSSTFSNTKAIVVIGISGCGKTTVAQLLAQHLGCLFIDADDYHSSECKRQMSSGVPLTDFQRESWIDRLGQCLQRQQSLAHSCIMAFSGLKQIHRQRLRNAGVPIQFFFLNTSPSVVAKRLEHRQGHFMPASLLNSQIATLEPPIDEPDVISIHSDGSPAEVVASILFYLTHTSSNVCEISSQGRD